jgi:hypothetical protein
MTKKLVVTKRFEVATYPSGKVFAEVGDVIKVRDKDSEHYFVYQVGDRATPSRWMRKGWVDHHTEEYSKDKHSKLKKQIKETIIGILSEEEGAIELKKGTPDSEIKKYTSKGLNVKLTEKKDEEEDDVEVEDTYGKVDKEDMYVEKEPTAKDIKKERSVSKLHAELSSITKQLKKGLAKTKEIASKPSDKRTQEDKKHLEDMKRLTKLKKELESKLKLDDSEMD